MKIGVLSDIHGNHLALEAVLKEARKLGVEKLLILGDLVGYYYHSVEVLRQLEEWSTEMIGGNHEEMMKLAQKDYAFSESVHYK
ncbi:MAG: metallophosphoesterase family protein, partial [Pseudanabaena sp.]